MGQCCCAKLDADFMDEAAANGEDSDGEAVARLNADTDNATDVAATANGAQEQRRRPPSRSRRKSTRCASIVDKELFGDIPSDLSHQARKEVFLLRGMVKSGLLPLRSYVMIAAEIVDDDFKLARLVDGSGIGAAGGGLGDGGAGTSSSRSRSPQPAARVANGNWNANKGD